MIKGGGGITTQERLSGATGDSNIIAYRTREEDEHVLALVPSIAVGEGGVGLCNMEPAAPPSSSPPTKRSKLAHSSFRIEEDVIKALEREAQKRGASLSSLVNRTLKNYVTSEMYFEELGFILVSKDFLRKLFVRMDEKDIVDFGRELGLTVAKEYVSYFFPQVKGDTLGQFLDLWFRRFQSCQHRVDGNRHCFSVNHDISMNFSIALKAILEALIEPIIKETVDFTTLTATTIAFSFYI